MTSAKADDHRRAQARERKRRQREHQTPEQCHAELAANAARQRARRTSTAYRKLSPEERHHAKGRPGIPLRERPFAGVDGEGGYRHRATCGGQPPSCGCRQEYVALTAGDQTLQNQDGSRLTTWQCLAFLTALRKDRRYVAFWFDYDVSQIVRDLPEWALRRLAGISRGRGDREFVYVKDPATGALYGLRHISHKFLTIVRVGKPVVDSDGAVVLGSQGKPKRVPGSGARITIYDVSGYFQGPFLQVLDDWEVGTAEERRLIANGKLSRSAFTLPLPSWVKAYNLLECRLLAQLMDAVDGTAARLGLVLRKWYGAGTLAELLLDKHDIGHYREEAPRNAELTDAIDRAYFGGRFETAVIGIVPELHNIDIASAHPAAMVTLPCLAHGKWRHHTRIGRRKVEALHASAVVKVRWDVSLACAAGFGPFPYRGRDGSLRYPLMGRGWYWVEEVRAAMNCFGVDCFLVEEAWEFVPECDHQPFAWVPGVYAERQRLGKNRQGRILKLALNSVYGKLAQTVGKASYAEFVWAGMITARTRARMLEVLEKASSHLLMIATDGAYLDCSPVSVGIGISDTPALGGWEYDANAHLHRDVLIVEPGLWLSHTGDVLGKEGESRSVVRARGFGTQTLAATNAHERLLDAFMRDGIDAEVVIGPEHLVEGAAMPMAYVGYRAALYRGRPEEVGTWQPFQKKISFNPSPKRVAIPGDEGKSLVRTRPAPTGGKLVRFGIDEPLELSAPYRRLQVKDQEREIYYEQPDRDIRVEQFLAPYGDAEIA